MAFLDGICENAKQKCEIGNFGQALPKEQPEHCSLFQKEKHLIDTFTTTKKNLPPQQS